MDTFCGFKEPRPFNAAEQQAIDQLKQMFKPTTNIHFQTDNYFLTRFLRYRDWDVQAAYESIKNYYKIKVTTAVLVHEAFSLSILLNCEFIFSVIIRKCIYKKTYRNTWIYWTWIREWYSISAIKMGESFLWPN